MAAAGSERELFWHMSLPTKAPKHGPSIYHQLSHAGRRLAAQTGGEGRTAGPPRVGRHGAGDVVAALGLNLRSRRLVCRAREPERSGQRAERKMSEDFRPLHSYDKRVETDILGGRGHGILERLAHVRGSPPCKDPRIQAAGTAPRRQPARRLCF